MASGALIMERAEGLAAKGDVGSAVDLLEQGAAAGDPNALFALGIWLDSGRHVSRDPARARECFGKAADSGHAQADTIFTNYLGSGTGGPRDWPAAVGRLRTRAASNARARAELDLLERMDLDAAGNPGTSVVGRQLSDSPWVQIFPALFTNAECHYLAAAASPFLQPATVVDNATGKAIRNPIRTSHTAVLTPPLESLVVRALNRRLAAVTGTEVEQGEPLQVLRYTEGQEYKPHIDAIPSLDNQRKMTALVYLNEGYEGGETLFVASGLAIRGRLGTGIAFRNVDSEGRPDKQAAHCGRPVTKGAKLLASRWIRERAFNRP